MLWLLLLSVVTFSDSADYNAALELARARANVIGIEVSKPLEVVPKIQVPTIAPLPQEANKKQELELPVVTMYTASFPCPPCDHAKADAVNGRFPFRLVVREHPPKGMVVDSWPTFHWNGIDGKGKRWPPPMGEYENYIDAKQFIAIWQKTQEVPKKAASAKPANPLNGNYPHYGVWGMSMEYHVRADHGINTKGLTPHELQKAHDAVHAGVAPATINAYLRSR